MESLPTVQEQVLKSLLRISAYERGDELDAGLIQEGIEELNDILQHYSATGIMIPYDTTLVFNIGSAKDIYSISNYMAADVDSPCLITIDSTPYLDYPAGFQWPLYPLLKQQLDGQAINTRLKNTPTNLVFYRQNLVSYLRFYPWPDRTYECTIKGKCAMPSLSLGDPLSVVPPQYRRFLDLKLAQSLQSKYGSVQLTDDDRKEIETMEKVLRTASDVNNSLYASSSFRGQADGYANWSMFYTGYA